MAGADLSHPRSPSPPSPAPSSAAEYGGAGEELEGVDHRPPGLLVDGDVGEHTAPGDHVGVPIVRSRLRARGRWRGRSARWRRAAPIGRRRPCSGARRRPLPRSARAAGGPARATRRRDRRHGSWWTIRSRRSTRRRIAVRSMSTAVRRTSSAVGRRDRQGSAGRRTSGWQPARRRRPTDVIDVVGGDHRVTRRLGDDDVGPGAYRGGERCDVARRLRREPSGVAGGEPRRAAATHTRDVAHDAILRVDVDERACRSLAAGTRRDRSGTP